MQSQSGVKLAQSVLHIHKCIFYDNFPEIILKRAICGGEDERGCSRKEDIWPVTEKC
jgi:hypothetical protein